MLVPAFRVEIRISKNAYFYLVQACCSSGAAFENTIAEKHIKILLQSRGCQKLVRKYSRKGLKSVAQGAYYIVAPRPQVLPD
jgi:hypothetical protein